jgi:hypothetical protein
MAISATLTSTTGTATCVLNPVAKATTIQLTLTASSTGAMQLEVSLDDPTIVGGPTATWSLLSSGSAMLSSNIGGSAGGLTYSFLTPVGGVRINSTANSGTAILKALQSVTG